MNRVYRRERGTPAQRPGGSAQTDRAGDELRPGLEPIPRRLHRFRRHEGSRELVALADLDVATIGLDGEDDPEVDGAHRVAVVVQHPDEPEVRRPIGDELLCPLAPEPGHERVLAVVHRVQVPADADAGLAVQAPVAARIGPFHEEDPLPVADEDVRNELLVVRILLGDRPLEIAAVGRDRGPERHERRFVGWADSVEVAATRHGGAREDQHALRHRPPSLPIGCQVGGKVWGIDCVSIPFRTALLRTAQRAPKCGADRQQPRSETVVRGQTRY